VAGAILDADGAAAMAGGGDGQDGGSHGGGGDGPEFLVGHTFAAPDCVGVRGGLMGPLGERRHAEGDRLQSSDDDFGLGMDGRPAILPGELGTVAMSCRSCACAAEADISGMHKTRRVNRIGTPRLLLSASENARTRPRFCEECSFVCY